MSLLDNIINYKELATLPSVTKRVMDLLQDDDVDVRRIARIIERDPVLAFKVLRVVNSPVFATPTRITSIHQAIMLMGFSRLTNIVLSVSIFSRFWFAKHKGVERLMNKFWWHSSSAGIVAKVVGSKIREDSHREIEVMGGLLHQIGKVAMLQYNVEQYKKVIQLILKEGMIDSMAEKKVFGLSHLNVGVEMATKWRLGDEMKSVMAYYQTPSKISGNKDLPASVGLASVVCAQHGADFYNGLRLNSITEAEQWKVLCESSENLKTQGPNAITENISQHLKESAQYLIALKGNLASA
ncbi:MAG: metal-dependent phosphohydrolase [Ignavibacteria bacterium]|nr:metal-dependent phosphohydrolase [Ignavibacteria bacterium]